ncbi:MAG: tetratricopeptide repeat protein [Ginsengibacter sp.]
MAKQKNDSFKKNVVEGNVSAQHVDIGDKHYHYAAKKLPKELNINIPRISPDEIIGREEDLKALHDLLCDDKRVVVVNGLGGIGKTTLAQAYVSKYYDDYPHIVWITQGAEDIINDFINAEGLLKNLEIEAGNPEPQQLFSEVIRKLKGITEKPNLLVIDNAEQSLKQYKDILPSQPNWHLLVTSREEIMGFHLKPIDFLSEEQSIQLFEKFYTRYQLTDEDVKKLVKSVDYHTLTIEILSKTAQVQRYNSATLLQAIEKDIKAHVEVSRELGEVERVATYLSNVFNMNKLGKEEIWLMKQFACLPPEFHTYFLLNELLANEKSAFKDSLAETCNKIAQKGWLQYNTVTDSYKMHRIVAGVVKRQHAIDIDDVKGLFDNITSKLNIDYTKDNSVDKFIWIPFGKILLNCLDSSSEISRLQNNLADVLQELGDYKGAKVLLEKAMACDEKYFGNDDPSTMASYSNLAMVLKDLGDYEGAKVLLEKVMAFYEKNFRKDHPSIARSYSNLAVVLWRLGNYDGARILLKKTLASDKKYFGKAHPIAAINYSNLAGVLKDLGDHKGARVLLEKALALDEKNFEEGHPVIATRYSNLALVLQKLGDYDGARVLLEKALASDEKNFGKDHPSTAASYSNLAGVFRDLGDYERARVLLKKAVTSAEKIFGKDHPLTGLYYSRLALVLQDLGDYDGAKVLLEKALTSDEKNFGKDHPSTAGNYSNLAGILHDLGNYEEAKILLKNALASHEKILGKGHPDTAIIYSNLALVLQDLGDYDGAKVLLTKAIASDEKNFGKDHPSTAKNYWFLASLLNVLGEYDMALELCEKAINIYNIVLQESHPHVKRIKNLYKSIKEKPGVL